MSQFIVDSIFWVEVNRIKPNPLQPRREFDEQKLKDLAESIRQYGVLQPLVVTRKETEKADGGIVVEYELIAGERRLRASKLAGLAQVPVIIRDASDGEKMKLELAIIENLQREDLNPMDRARAFDRLVNEFGFKHTQVAERIGKSREYVSNSIRLLAMPAAMQEALVAGTITEGHTRPLLMLVDRPEQQETLFKEIILKRLTVREAEHIARRIATDRARKKELEPELADLERQLTETLGTRVRIEKRENGGRLLIDYFTPEDLRSLASRLEQKQQVEKPAQSTEDASPAPPDDRSKEEKEKEEEELYSIKNFSI